MCNETLCECNPVCGILKILPPPEIKRPDRRLGPVAFLQAVSSDPVAVPQSLKTRGCPDKGPESFFARKRQAKCPLSGRQANSPVVLKRGPENFFEGCLKRNATFRSEHPFGLYNIKGDDLKPESWDFGQKRSIVPGPLFQTGARLGKQRMVLIFSKPS